MTDALQEQVHNARRDLSKTMESVFEELGRLYVDGYGGSSWGCTQSVTVDSIEWTFKYTTDDEHIQFVCGTYAYDQPEFDLNHYTYEFERTGTTRQERDVYAVSQYDPPNAWDLLHILPSTTNAINSYLEDLTHFNAHEDTPAEILENNEQLANAIADLENEATAFTETISTVQAGMTVSDLVASIEHGYEDLAAIGICDDEADKDSVWKMFHWFGDNGPEMTQRDIKFTNDTIVLVEVERCYRGDWYSVGYVVGEDDGDTPFFIHRLRSAEELTEHDGDWTEAEVYELMGFDKNLESDSIEYDTRYRVQGDVFTERRELDDELETVRRTHTRNHLRDTTKEYADEYLTEREWEFFTSDPYSFHTNRVTADDSPLFKWDGEYSTEEVKQIQDQVNITESQVRDEQDARRYARLSAKRRREIVRDLLEDRFFQWCKQQHSVDIDTVRNTAEHEITDAYEATDESCPITLGNHLVNALNATLHPDSRRNFEEDIEIVIPEETQVYFIHDEHTPHIITLPRGIYNFGFLTQHFNT